MPRLDGMFGLDLLLVILHCLDDSKRHCGVCPDCTEDNYLTKAQGLTGAVSSQRLPLGHGPAASFFCSAHPSLLAKRRSII